jgi:type I restriction enzyme S subunit
LNGSTRKEIAKVAQGDTVVHLYPSQLGSLQVTCPNDADQQKIADCLTSLDEVIAAQGRKVEALKAHKRGLMQQLFPHEGETVPRLRFPEFRNKAVWRAKRLEDVAAQDFTNGIFNDTKMDASPYRLINVSEMYLPNPLVGTDLAFARAPEEEIEKKLALYGDVFFTRSSLVREGIAHSNIYLGSDHKTTFDGHLIRLRPDVKIVEPLFLHYALKSNKLRLQLVSKSKTATMTTIGQDDVAETTLSVPQPAEQRRIADCLSSLDTQIAAESAQFDAFKIHKNGLMQQLFPSPEQAA